MKKSLLILALVISPIFAGNCLKVGQFFEQKMKENHTALYRFLDGEKENNVNCMIEAARMISEYGTFGLNFDPKQKQVQLLEKVLKIQPYNSLAHYNLGSFYYNEKDDEKSRYHFLLSYHLGDKDSVEYLRTLPFVKSYEKDMMIDGRFDTKKLLTQISIFSSYNGTYQTKLNYADSGHSKTTLENHFGMKVVVSDNSIELRSIANKQNAILLGRMIKTIQYALFIDIPQKTTEITDEYLIDGVIAQTLMGKQTADKSFSNIFTHRLTFDNNSREFIYTIKIKG